MRCPAAAAIWRRRVCTLSYDTVVRNSYVFDNDIAKVPKQALTMGIGTM